MKKTLTDLDRSELAGKTVLVRADLNVPMDDGEIRDDQRLEASLPTLRLLRDAGARVVLLSHLGRPKGEPNPLLSLAPVARRLAALLGGDVRFVADPSGRALGAAASADIVVLENTRYLPGETENDPTLSAEWADFGELFVNDAFGVAHRAHASTAGLAAAMRAKGGEAVAGLLMARELRFLREALREPARPYVAILGGAKMSGKIDMISALLGRVDRLLVGGAMANTFFRAMGLCTGTSLVEDDRVPVAAGLLETAGDTMVLPIDCVVAEVLEEGAPHRVVRRSDVGQRDRIVDIGPATVAAFGDIVADAGTIVWNGPMGVFEIPAFAPGTLGIADAVAEACDAGSLVVVGGGDSARAAELAGVTDRLTHVSSGGGASLALMAGNTLPGVVSLSDAE